MLDVKDPLKELKELCTKLGDDYDIQVFDLEKVIYRNLDSGCCIEIGELDNYKSNMNAIIYVCHIETSKIIDTINNINSFENLKQTLSEVIEKYSAY